MAVVEALADVVQEVLVDEEDEAVAEEEAVSEADNLIRDHLNVLLVRHFVLFFNHNNVSP